MDLWFPRDAHRLRLPGGCLTLKDIITRVHCYVLKGDTIGIAWPVNVESCNPQSD